MQQINPENKTSPSGAEGQAPHESIFPIKKTRMGARTLVRALSPTVKVEERWGNTHGEARVRGSGLILLKNISNSGIHRCQVLEIQDGFIVKVVEENTGSRFCSICEKYGDE